MVLTGSNQQLYETHIKFYSEFISNLAELEHFIAEKLEYQEDMTPRRMINTVQRLLTLSDEMENIKPGKRDLSIFFILTCVESLFTLQKQEVRIQKQEMIIRFFNEYIDYTDKQFLIDKVKISKIGEEQPYFNSITIEQIALLMCVIRNKVAHEGIYWSFSFYDESQDFSILNIINSKLRKDQGYQLITYEVDLTYNDFRKICMKGFINFLNDYFRRNCSKNM
ncbi:hypothetical protein [Clostridium estertheticum]|uniref:hypothetical protein n=1 Tax=Clostridium estertheticum TaxID=238834 RepID=UPI001C0D6302|nr:hypothetical protein [Clostridium estertheticum]MBU3072526.1 hypothetical protein [Clostridium estertheticum]MBU3162619.1 hypothetical protein [Clostridium estertheticum]